MTFDDLSVQILEKHYAEIPFSIDRAQIEETVAAFFRFLELPTDVKEKLSFMEVLEGQEARVGYSARKQEYGNNDDKEYFHFHRRGAKLFSELPEGQTPQAQEFFKKATQIYDVAHDCFRSIIQAFDTKFPGLYTASFPESDDARLYLRFLKYQSGDSANFLAKGHYDRGGCTLAIAESAPGLRIGTNPENVKPVQHKPGMAMFFPSMRFHEYTSPAFEPSWHDVVQLASDAYSQSSARWAVVMFMNIPGMRPVFTQETHQPR